MSIYSSSKQPAYLFQTAIGALHAMRQSRTSSRIFFAVLSTSVHPCTFFITVNLHVYHYAGNNPVKYTDSDGKQVFMAGVTVTVGACTALSYEVGIILSVDKQGNYQIGAYQMVKENLVRKHGIKL